MNIGSRLELFVDDYLIEKMRGVALKLQAPQAQEVAVQFDQPWEGAYSAYPSVLREGELLRLYYRGLQTDGSREVTCVAESADGKEWVKPKLGLVEWKGSRENNICWGGYGNHCFAPFIDLNPRAKKSERYKALAGCPPAGLVSPDGLQWKQVGKPPLIRQGAFDSLNLAFWDTVQGQYVAYVRTWDDGGGKVTNDFVGYRSIGRATSPDFREWSDTVEIDYGGSPREQLYTNAITPYFRAPHIYLGFPKRFMEERHLLTEYPEPGISETVFMTSRDGQHWDRRFMEAMIRPGRDRLNWSDRSIMTAWGVVQTGADELSIYYTENYRYKSNRLRRASLRLDGFVSVNAGYAGGAMLTKPFVYAGSELVLNYATSAAGSVQVEIQEENGKALPGFALQDCALMYGDEIEKKVQWRGGSVSELAGQRVRLRFVMKDADLFAMRFR